jgi:adenine-specific DNA-methyltransferase
MMLAERELTWQRSRHAAVRTDEYLFHQLIPYLGNKRKLLPLIREAIARTGVESGTFVDLFAGSGVVSRLAKTLGFRVVANDWEPYCREINGAYVGCNRPPAFEGIGPGGSAAAFATLNALPPIDGYVARHLCPRDDAAVDPAVDRLFFTRRNGGRLDAMREQIRAWEEDGRIGPAERSYLLAALIYAASYASNTSGVFKGFHRGWGGATGTALYRILAPVRLAPPATFDNGATNLVTALDAQELAENLGASASDGDLAYLDPPYNQHPYGSNYHVLNTIALGDQPAVSPTISGARDKSAIRQDWRTLRRSPYNYRQEAPAALERLLASLRCRFILLSYSTDGLIPIELVVDLACRRGRAEVITRRYKRYRVSTQRFSLRGHTVELLLVIDARARPEPSRSGEILSTIENEIHRRGAEDAEGDTDCPVPSSAPSAPLR